MNFIADAAHGDVPDALGDEGRHLSVALAVLGKHLVGGEDITLPGGEVAVTEEEGVGQKSGGILKNTNELLPEQYLQKKETAAALKEGLASLREKEQMVLSLYYINELNMKEISVVMQVSEPRISQIHANAIRKLRNYMQRFFDEKE